MIKKILIVVLLISSVLFISGCRLQASSNPLYSDLKEDFDRSADMKCEYFDEENNPLMVYIKGKDEIIRIDGTKALDQIGSILVKNNQLWWWGENQKKGIVFDLSTNESYTYRKIAFNPQDFMEKINLQRQNCSPALVSNSLFNPPPEVNFVNFYLYFENSENTN